MSVADMPITSQITTNVRRLLRHVLGHENQAEPARQEPASPDLRPSKGLRDFWKALDPDESLRILDLGAASQSNINFITGLGHSLCTEDLLHSLQFTSARKSVEEEENPEAIIERFFRKNLAYGKDQFDGVLCWDLLDFLPDALIDPLVDRLHECLKPDGQLLAFFHSGQPGQLGELSQYRILAENQLQVSNRGNARPWRSFNNRSIERIFRNYASLKFYLTRDSLREVIIVR